MSENVNRNDCPIPAPEEQKPDKQAIDDLWKKTIGAARVEISTRAVGKAVEDEFKTGDVWNECLGCGGSLKLFEMRGLCKECATDTYADRD